MRIGVVGLGKMGGSMVRRLILGGHEVVAYDIDRQALAQAVSDGAMGATDLDHLCGQLAAPRIVWVMLPAGDPTGRTIHALGELLHADDIIVDGGNSNYQDAEVWSMELETGGIHFVDVGTSGGIRGEDAGYNLMIGGSAEVVERLKPIFQSLAPAPDRGWGHVGPAGAGHFVKMVHNGIEYGAMQALSEGFAILAAKRELDLNLENIATVWQDGSVIRSWLLDVAVEILSEDPTLAGIAPRVADSGEGRLAVREAIDLNVAAPVITTSLLARIKSQDGDGYAERLLSAMRSRFGGHVVFGTREE